MEILVINGVNLDMLGKRNIIHYGNLTLAELEKLIIDYAAGIGVNVKCVSSNYEGKIVEFITSTTADAIILNAGAYSHYSYAIRDAIECANKPTIEVHLSDINNREDFRKLRVFKDVVDCEFIGLKELGYIKAIDYLVSKYNK